MELVFIIIAGNLGILYLIYEFIKDLFTPSYATIQRRVQKRIDERPTLVDIDKQYGIVYDKYMALPIEKRSGSDGINPFDAFCADNGIVPLERWLKGYSTCFDGGDYPIKEYKTVKYVYDKLHEVRSDVPRLYEARRADGTGAISYAWEYSDEFFLNMSKYVKGDRGIIVKEYTGLEQEGN